MYWNEKTNKLSRFIYNLRDKDKRKVFLDNLKKRGLGLKKAIAIGALLTTLSMPSIARADSPVEFEFEGLMDSTFEMMVEQANLENKDVNIEDWLVYILESGRINDANEEEAYEIEITNHEDDYRFNWKYVLPSKLISDKGQEQLLRYISSIPTLKDVVISASFPIETVLAIRDAGYNVSLKSNNTAIIGIDSLVEKQNAIAIYKLEERERDNSDYPIYENATQSRVSFEKSLADLNSDELAIISYDTYKECMANSEGKVCVRICSVNELSTEEAIKLKGKVDFIQIASVDNYSGREAREVYTIDEYGKVSQEIDKIVDKINPDSSEFEKALVIYCEIANHTVYNHEEAAKGNDRRKEVGNLYGVFVEGSSVCAGLSEGYVALCDRVGLNAEVIGCQNEGAEVGHAINQVQINGIWVDLDITGDLNNIHNGESLRNFGKMHIDFDHMTSNHHDTERGILNQEVVEHFYRNIMRKMEIEEKKKVIKEVDDLEV